MLVGFFSKARTAQRKLLSNNIVVVLGAKCKSSRVVCWHFILHSRRKLLSALTLTLIQYGTETKYILKPPSFSFLVVVIVVDHLAGVGTVALC